MDARAFQVGRDSDAHVGDDAAFERQVRDFALANCPSGSRAKVAAGVKLARADVLGWQRILHRRGWGAPGWPREFGGTGWSARRRLAFERALASCDCPPQPHQGLRHIGPVLMRYGTPDQQRRFLPPVIAGEHLWCQGFSEPAAGSDLAALSTRAERRGDRYVVNGQKLWTSHAHEADMMFALVRTDPASRRKEGITMLLVPMDLPGLTVRPLRTLDGWHHVNEVFLQDVEVPLHLRVGEEGQGWDIAAYLLARERLGPVELLPGAVRLMQRVRAMAPAGAHAPEGEDWASRLLRVEADLSAYGEIGERAIDAGADEDALGCTPSLLKLGWAHAVQEISEVALEMVGPTQAVRHAAMGEVPRGIEEARGAVWQSHLLHRAFSIYGGSSEIQKTLIARQMFEGAATRVQALVPGDLHDSAARFALEREPRLHLQAAEGYAKALCEAWDDAARLGWPGVLLPSAADPQGGAVDDLAALVEGLGGRGMPLPVAACGVTALLLLPLASDWPAARRLLDGMAAGRVRVCNLLEPLARPCVAVQTDAVASGVAEAEGVPANTHLLLPFRTPGAGLRLMIVPRAAPGAAIEEFLRIDGGIGVRIALDRVRVPADHLSPAGQSCALSHATAVAVWNTLACVEAQALMGALAEALVRHLSTRVQFGVPLSQQQVLRHRAVDVFMAWQRLRAQSARALRAVCSMARGEPGTLRDVTLAMVLLRRHARECANAAIQMHGGLGLCEELQAARLCRRLMAAPFRLAPWVEEPHGT